MHEVVVIATTPSSDRVSLRQGLVLGLESVEGLPAFPSVHVKDEDAARLVRITGPKPDQGVWVIGPPAADLCFICGGVVEAVPRGGALVLVAGKDRHATPGVLECRLQH